MRTHAVLAALAILPTSGSDGWKDLTGESAPAIEAATWFNTSGAPGAADLQGKVVLLEFFATW